MKNKTKIIDDILQNKWLAMEKFIPFMSKYLHDKEIAFGLTAEDILKLMSECLTVIFGELNNELGTLNKYKAKCYTESDFVDMVIESIGQEIPDKDDKAGTLEYVEDFRVILWGYTNYHANKYLELYTSIVAHKLGEADAGNSFDTFRECMTIVMVECLLRSMERHVSHPRLK